MIEDNKNKQMLQEDWEDSLFNYDNVASTMDCTGLIPAAPASGAEVESYTDIYAIPQPADERPDDLQQLKGNSRTR